jgi:hypothetical protein
VMTGHAIAEEAVLYPALGPTARKPHCMLAYGEQSRVKVDLAALETMEPMCQDYLDRLDRLRQAVARHLHAEEAHWFPALARQGTASERLRLAVRYREEFDRYMGVDADLS